VHKEIDLDAEVQASGFSKDDAMMLDEVRRQPNIRKQTNKRANKQTNKQARRRTMGGDASRGTGTEAPGRPGCVQFHAGLAMLEEGERDGQDSDDG
jgi:hypothetical protein